MDTIVGEKLLDKNSIRPSNFNQILRVPANYLEKESISWKITKLSSEYYLLDHNTNFAFSRPTAILVKIQANKIVLYKEIEDYNVKKAIAANGYVYALCDDFKEGRGAWPAKYDIQVLALNHELKETWSYKTISREYPFEANDLILKKDTLVAKVNIITGCSICYSTVAILFNRKGKIFAYSQAGGQNDGGWRPNQETMERIFRKE